MFEFLFKYSPDIYARSELIFASEWPTWVPTVLTLVGAAAIIVMLLRRIRHTRPLQLFIIAALQISMLAIIVVMLMQPTLTSEVLKPGENTVALVLDNSESMRYGDPEPRYVAGREILESIIDNNAVLDMDPQFYTLAASTERVETLDGVEPQGQSTQIAEGLREVLEGARNESLAAIILSSDGVDTTGNVKPETLAEIASFGVPVHTIGVGRSSIPEDLEITRVLVPESSLPGSTLSARVSVRHDRGGPARITVYSGDELLQSKAIELRDDFDSTTVPVDVQLPEAGSHRLRFTIDGDTEEPERRNNRHTSIVNVENKAFSILYYEGEPRWEFKFIRRAVHDDEELDLVTLLRVSPHKFYRQGLATAEELEDGFPTTRSDLFAYDALIIGSVEAASFSEEQLDLVRAFVSERGGSLLLLAGRNGLGSGGWGQSAVADLLPTRLPPSTDNSFVRVQALARLTTHGADTAMLRFADGPDENRRAWDELPAVADVQSTGELKPAAITLLEAQTQSGWQPLLVTQPFGRGHTYILASGGTWRWQMSLPLEDQRHETFWRQFLRALVAHTPSASSLSTSGQGTNVRLRAEFRDDAYRPVGGIKVSTVMSHEDGDTTTVDLLPSATEAGVFEADVAPPASGMWYFEAIARRDDETLAAARTSHYSEAETAEHFNIRRSDTLLRRLSQVTGGSYFDASQLDGLGDLLRFSSAGITEQIRRPLWDAPVLFLLLLLLKSSEWLLRRRWSSI